jgi:hypothetical protein
MNMFHQKRFMKFKNIDIDDKETIKNNKKER